MIPGFHADISVFDTNNRIPCALDFGQGLHFQKQRHSENEAT